MLRKITSLAVSQVPMQPMTDITVPAKWCKESWEIKNVLYNVLIYLVADVHMCKIFFHSVTIIIQIHSKCGFERFYKLW